jgi:hypothetical protein
LPRRFDRIKNYATIYQLFGNKEFPSFQAGDFFRAQCRNFAKKAEIELLQGVSFFAPVGLCFFTAPCRSEGGQVI